MIIQQSTRENPTYPVCECGYPVQMVLHHDFLEGYCTKCFKTFVVPVKRGGHIWNCCCPPENEPAHKPEYINGVLKTK